MKPLDVIMAKKAHLKRLSNKKGATGELAVIETIDSWIPRPKGSKLKLLLNELSKTGVSVKWSSFDAIDIPQPINFEDPAVIQHYLPKMLFIEIKTANQKRVKSGFDGFFFALTENEISAAEQLGDRYRVALFNAKSNELLLTSVADIVARAKSKTWQVSVQL